MARIAWRRCQGFAPLLPSKPHKAAVGLSSLPDIQPPAPRKTKLRPRLSAGAVSHLEAEKPLADHGELPAGNSVTPSSHRASFCLGWLSWSPPPCKTNCHIYPRESSPPLSYFGLRKLQLSVGVDIRPLFDATGSRLSRHAAVEPFKSIVAASSSSIRSRSPVAAQAMRFFAI